MITHYLVWHDNHYLKVKLTKDLGNGWFLAVPLDGGESFRVRYSLLHKLDRTRKP